MTNGSLMKVEIMLPWGILQYFLPSLSDNWSSNQILVFLSVVVLRRFYCIFKYIINFAEMHVKDSLAHQIF